MQIVNYAVASGIRYAGLTNGDHWDVYDVFQQVELDKKRISDVSISTALIQESVLKFLPLWYPNLESGLPVSVPQPPPPSQWQSVSHPSSFLRVRECSAVQIGNSERID